MIPDRNGSRARGPWSTLPAGGAGGADGPQDAGVHPRDEREVLVGEVGAQLPARLGAGDQPATKVVQGGDRVTSTWPRRKEAGDASLHPPQPRRAAPAARGPARP